MFFSFPIKSIVNWGVPMSETMFRLLLGSLIIIFQYFSFTYGFYFLTIYLIAEGITNARFTRFCCVLRKINYGDESEINQNYKVNFEADRALRLIIATFIIVSAIVFKQQLWFFPWFMGFMLFTSGITSICPMQLLLKWIGFR